jgi:hypothetical protein
VSRERTDGEYGTESKEMSESVNSVEFLDWLSDHQLVTNNFDAFKITGESL